MPRYLVHRDKDLVITHDVEHDHAVQRTTQLNYGEVMSDIQEQKKADQRRFLGGYKVGSIPLNDIPMVKARYPELFTACDEHVKKLALVRFSKDPDMRPYLVKHA